MDTGERLGKEDFSITSALAPTASMVASILSATVAAAAFTIGAAQQRRSLALVRLTGAPDRILRQIVTVQGLLLRGIGAATGIVLGTMAGVVQVLMDLDKVPRTFHALTIPWLQILGMAAFNLTATVLAAWLPARRLARLSAVDAVRTDVQLPKAARPSMPGLVAIVLGLVVAVAGGLLARGRMEDWTAPGWARLNGNTVDGTLPGITDAQLAKIRGVLDDTVGPVRGMGQGKELGLTLPQCADYGCSSRQVGASIELDQLSALLGEEATPAVLSAFDQGPWWSTAEHRWRTAGSRCGFRWAARARRRCGWPRCRCRPPEGRSWCHRRP